MSFRDHFRSWLGKPPTKIFLNQAREYIGMRLGWCNALHALSLLGMPCLGSPVIFFYSGKCIFPKQNILYIPDICFTFLGLELYILVLENKFKKKKFGKEKKRLFVNKEGLYLAVIPMLDMEKTREVVSSWVLRGNS